MSSTTRQGFRSRPGRRTVSAGSSASAVSTPTRIASWVARRICTRELAICPVMCRRGSCGPPEAKPSAVSASFSVTQGRPSVTRRMWPRWSRRAWSAPDPTSTLIPAARSLACPCPATCGIGVLERGDDPGDPGRDDRVGAGRRGPGMRAGLERHIEGRAARRLSGLGDGERLGVRPSAGRGRRRGRRRRRPSPEWRRRRVGRGEPERPLAEIEGGGHPAPVLVGIRRRRPGHCAGVSLRGRASLAGAASGSASSSPTMALKSRASRKLR